LQLSFLALSLADTKARSGEAPESAVSQFRMIGFEGRRRWRRSYQFKLRARLFRRKISNDFKVLDHLPEDIAGKIPHVKLAIRSFVVRRTNSKHAAYETSKSTVLCSTKGQGHAAIPHKFACDFEISVARSLAQALL